MKLFPAKISERASSQKSMTSEGNSALLTDGRRLDNIYSFKISSHITNHLKSGPSGDNLFSVSWKPIFWQTVSV